MHDLSALKSQKLRSLMEQSVKFSNLPKEEKQSTIDAITKLSVEQQEATYCPFFEDENKKEQPAKDQAMAALVSQLEESDKKITLMARKDQEEMSKTKEGAQQVDLLNQLNNF